MSHSKKMQQTLSFAFLTFVFLSIVVKISKNTILLCGPLKIKFHEKKKYDIPCNNKFLTSKAKTKRKISLKRQNNGTLEE